MFTTALIQRSFVIIGALILMGILVHDTRFDKAAALALSIPLGVASIGMAQTAKIKGDAHTHVERIAVDKTAGMLNGTPTAKPRSIHRKYMLTQHLKGFNIPEPHTLVLQSALA